MQIVIVSTIHWRLVIKKTITFELSGDDVREAISEFINKRHPNVKYENSDIHFAAIADSTDATKIVGVAASLTAVEEERKKSGTVSRKQVSPSDPKRSDAGTSGTSS